jgi:hypothetical protein
MRARWLIRPVCFRRQHRTWTQVVIATLTGVLTVPPFVLCRIGHLGLAVPVTAVRSGHSCRGLKVVSRVSGVPNGAGGCFHVVITQAARERGVQHGCIGVGGICFTSRRPRGISRHTIAFIPKARPPNPLTATRRSALSSSDERRPEGVTRRRWSPRLAMSPRRRACRPCSRPWPPG